MPRTPPVGEYGTAEPSRGLQLKVIGAGFGRTGTASTKLALEQLLGG
eukprot:gene15474-3328_t